MDRCLDKVAHMGVGVLLIHMGLPSGLPAMALLGVGGLIFACGLLSTLWTASMCNNSNSSNCKK